jgi:hypothetical protein
VFQGGQKIWGENLPIFWKTSPNNNEAIRFQNIYVKAQFENPKHVHQTTFETLKYNKPYFETA